MLFPTRIAVVVAFCAAAFGQEVVVQETIVVPLEWQSEMVGVFTSQPLTLTEEAPEGLELPKHQKADLAFATIALGIDLKLHIAFDFSERNTRFWVDEDLDQSLADSEVYLWQKTDSLWTQRVEVMVPFVGESKSVLVPMQLRCMARNPAASLTYIAQVHKSGAAVLGERYRKIAVRDESSRLDWSSDKGVVFLLDIDGNGRFAARHGEAEHFHPGDRFQIGQQAWRFRIQHEHGDQLELIPCEASESPTVPVWKPTPKPATATRVVASVTPVEDLQQRYEEQKLEPLRKRSATVSELGRVGTPEAFKLLLDIAKNDEADSLRVSAVRAMGNAEFLEVGGEALYALTKSKQTSVVVAAISSLYRMGHQKLERILIKLTSSEEVQIAAQAAVHLGYLGTADAVATLERLIKHDASTVRYRAYQGLRYQPEGPTLERMVAAARDQDYSLRALALLDLLAMEHSEARSLALAATDAQSFLSPGFADAVITVLLAAGDKVAIQAVFDIAGSNARGNLVPLAQPVTRLATMRSVAAMEVFTKALKDKSFEQRLLASRVFAEIGGDIAYEALSKQLKKEKNRLMIESLLEGLGRCTSPQAIPLLMAKAKRRGPQRLPAICALANNGLADSEARAFLLNLLESRYWEDRVVIVDAIGNSGDLSLAMSLLPALEDEEWQVRLSTIEAWRKLRCVELIDPLVQRLQVEDRLRLEKAIRQTLFVLTGQNPHMDSKSWAGWWNAAKGTFVMSKEVPKPRRSTGTISKKGFYGLTLDSDRVVFVIDTSGSMSAAAPKDDAMEGPGNRLDQALANAVQAVTLLADDAIVNVVLFGSGIRTWQSSMAPLKKKNRRDLLDFLDSQSPGGGTDLFDGLEVALLQEGVDRILLLSDGAPSGGRFVNTDDILREVKRLNQTSRIAIDCVSLGMKSPLLKRLAEENGGRYIER